MIRQAALIWALLASSAGAVELSLPQTARMTVDRTTAPDSYTAPISPFERGLMQTVTIEGQIARSAWRLEAGGLTPLQVLGPLRSQLQAAGYRIVLDCNAVTCGGFDFRFAVETLPGPNMYVNIRAYQFVTAIQGSLSDPENIVTVLASTSTSSAYVQIIQAGATTPAAPAASPENPPLQTTGDDLATALIARGHVVLAGLDFSSGTAGLNDDETDALESLAVFLRDRPRMRIALVGHTDSEGALDANIALSRDRADAVRARLIAEYDISPERVEARGMGYLAPVASNLTAEGREVNRRVEAILLPQD